MPGHQHVPRTIFSNSPVRKVVHFDDVISNPPQSATSISLLTSVSSTSLSLPLISEKPGVRFKLLILLLSLLIALTIGFILSLILVTQFIHLPARSPFSLLSEENLLDKNDLFKRFDSTLIDRFNFQSNICDNFYDFVCQKWLINHSLSPLDFKRSWLTERSEDIRGNFAKILANLSDIHAYNHQIEIEKNQTKELEIDDFNELTSSKNE